MGEALQRVLELKAGRAGKPDGERQGLPWDTVANRMENAQRLGYRFRLAQVGGIAVEYWGRHPRCEKVQQEVREIMAHHRVEAVEILKRWLQEQRSGVATAKKGGQI